MDNDLPTPGLPKGRDTLSFGPEFKAALPVSSCNLGRFNQLALQRKLDHEFVLESQEGTPNSPVFTYSLRVNGSLYYGSGSKKQLAKSEAAKAYFDYLAKERSSPLQNIESSAKSSEGLSFELPLNVNYVGNLHELCAKSNRPPPNYEFHLDPKTNMYKTICKSGDYTSEGEHISKKEAKKIASMNMLLMMGSKNKGTLPNNNDLMTPKPLSPPHINNKPQESGESTSETFQDKKRVPCFQKVLTQSDNLQNFIMGADIFEMSDVNYEKLLLDLSKVHGFQVIFEVQDDDQDKKICIVQLGVFPVIVGIGIGISDDEAKNTASKNVLSYLKVLLK